LVKNYSHYEWTWFFQMIRFRVINHLNLCFGWKYFTLWLQSFCYWFDPKLLFFLSRFDSNLPFFKQYDFKLIFGLIIILVSYYKITWFWFLYQIFVLKISDLTYFVRCKIEFDDNKLSNVMKLQQSSIKILILIS
jgi:hypothetical protein